MKPIEAGCLALIVGLVNDTQYNGLSVVAVRPIYRGEVYIGRDGVEYVLDDEPGWLVTRDEWQGEVAFDEKNLIRIDGTDLLTLQDAKEMVHG